MERLSGRLSRYAAVLVRCTALVLAAVAVAAAADAGDLLFTGRSEHLRPPAGQAARTRPAPAPGSSFDTLSKEATKAREESRTADAIPLYQRALKLNPSWSEGWWYLGTMLYDQDSYSAALEAFRKVTALEPHFGEAWALLGLCEFHERAYENALRDLERARALGLPASSLGKIARYHAAILFNRGGMFEMAISLLNGLVRQGDESPSIIEALGIAALRLRYLPSELPSEKREIVMMAGRAAFDAAARKPVDARREFEELVKRFPNEANVHYAFGTFLMQEEPDNGLREFERELEISPRHAPAMMQIAFEYMARGEPEKARPYAEKAAEVAPDMFATHTALGRVLLQLGETARAITELEKAVSMAPDSPENRFALANAYAKAGRKEDAARERAEFERLSKQRPKP